MRRTTYCRSNAIVFLPFFSALPLVVCAFARAADSADTQMKVTALVTQDEEPQSQGTARKAKPGELEEKTAIQLEEVVVTGTHIRGVSPASPVIAVTSTDIANSALSTTGDVL